MKQASCSSTDQGREAAHGRQVVYEIGPLGSAPPISTIPTLNSARRSKRGNCACCALAKGGLNSKAELPSTPPEPPLASCATPWPWQRRRGAFYALSSFRHLDTDLEIASHPDHTGIDRPGRHKTVVMARSALTCRRRYSCLPTR
jgi:hypothetical protein